MPSTPVPDPTLAPERPPSTASAIFAAFARLVIRYRYLALALNFALTAFFITWAPKLDADTSYKAMQVVDSEAQRVQDLLEDSFGSDQGHLIIVGGDVFSLGYLEKLKALHDDLAMLEMDLPSLGQRDLADGSPRPERQPATSATSATPGSPADDFGDFGEDAGWGDEAGGTIVDEIISLINVRNTTSEAGGLRVGGLLDEWPPQADQLDALRAYVMQQPSMAGKVVAKSGNYSMIFLRTNFMDLKDQAKVDREIRRVGAKYEGDDFKLQYTGMAAVNGEFQSLMLESIGICYLLSMLLMFAILVWTFRHPIGVLAPVLVVVQSVIWVIGALALTGTPMTLITTILPNFLTCVGIGDSVHILSTYRSARARGLECHDAIADAVSHTGRPVVFTSVTTAVGLLSFLFADLGAIANLGLFGAIGVTVAMMQSLVLVPVLLTFAPNATFGAKPAGEEGIPDSLAGRFLRFCVSLSAPRGEDMTRRNRVLLAAAALVLLGAAGASTLRVYYDPISWMPKDAETRRAFHIMDDHLGGSGSVQLLVEPAEGRTMRDYDLVERLAKLEDHMLAYEDENGRSIPTSTNGILEVVRDSWWALHEKRADAYELPDTPRGVSDVMTMFENSGPEYLKRVTTIDGSAAIVRMTMLHAPSSEYIPLLRHIERGVEEIVGDLAQVRVTGTMRQMVESDHAVLTDMSRSFVIALACITMLMVWMLGEFRLGVIAMVPNLLPLVVVLGYMAFRGIGIDTSNLLIGSIGIGIAVDDTIHFLHHFRVAYLVRGDREQAIAEAASRAGISIINTSVVLFGGFIVFAAAGLQNLVVFGELIAVTVVAALLIDLIFAPALLRLAYPATAPGRVAAVSDLPSA